LFRLLGGCDDQPIASLEDAVGLADLSAYEKRCSWHNRVTLQLVDIDMENPTFVMKNIWISMSTSFHIYII